jgi:hypothetical protein
MKAKAKGGGKNRLARLRGAEHFIARMGYKIRADVSIHKRFYFRFVLSAWRAQRTTEEFCDLNLKAQERRLLRSLQFGGTCRRVGRR